MIRSEIRGNNFTICGTMCTFINCFGDVRVIKRYERTYNYDAK